jgi:SprT protein
MKRRVEELYKLHHDKLFTDISIKLKFNHNKTRAAVCLFEPLEIQISEHYINSPTVNIEDITNTILHEFAHALAGFDAGHGVEWKRIAKSIGYTGGTCTERFILKDNYKYVFECGKGCVTRRHRKTRKLRICNKHKNIMNLKK